MSLTHSLAALDLVLARGALELAVLHQPIKEPLQLRLAPVVPNPPRYVPRFIRRRVSDLCCVSRRVSRRDLGVYLGAISAPAVGARCRDEHFEHVVDARERE